MNYIKRKIHLIKFFWNHSYYGSPIKFMLMNNLHLFEEQAVARKSPQPHPMFGSSYSAPRIRMVWQYTQEIRDFLKQSQAVAVELTAPTTFSEMAGLTMYDSGDDLGVIYFPYKEDAVQFKLRFL